MGMNMVKIEIKWYRHKDCRESTKCQPGPETVVRNDFL